MLSVLLLSARATTIPTMPIAPGVDIPMAGLGTWQYNDSVAEAATLAALNMGCVILNPSR
jgi:diketogulonate reductase-like aldo/keto reductase